MSRSKIQDSEMSFKQMQIFDFICRYIGQQGWPPTIMEIRDHFGYASNQSVVDHLNALASKGYLERVKKARGIIVKKGPLAQPGGIPILGDVAAGPPVLADERVKGFVAPGAKFPPEEHYALEVHGDSMRDMGIVDGDYVIVHFQEIVGNNEVAVAMIDGEVTVKRILFQEGGIILRAENQEIPDRFVNPGMDDFKIRGRVVGVYRELD